MTKLDSVLAVFGSVLLDVVSSTFTSCAHHYMSGAHTSGVYPILLNNQLVNLQCQMPNRQVERELRTPEVETIVRNAADTLPIDVDDRRRRDGTFGIQYQLTPAQLRELWQDSTRCIQTIQLRCYGNYRKRSAKLFTIEMADSAKQTIYESDCTQTDGVLSLTHAPVNIIPEPHTLVTYNLTVSLLRCSKQIGHLAPDCRFNFRQPNDQLSIDFNRSISSLAPRIMRFALRTYDWNIDNFVTVRTSTTGLGDVTFSVEKGYFLVLETNESSGGFRRRNAVSNERLLADGKWHTIEMRFEGTSIIVGVDQASHTHRAIDVLSNAAILSIIFRASPQPNNRQRYDLGSLTINGKVYCGAEARQLQSDQPLCDGSECTPCTTPVIDDTKLTDRKLLCPESNADDKLGYNFDGSENGDNFLQLRLTNPHTTFNKGASLTFRTTAKSGLLLWAYVRPDQETGPMKYSTLQMFFNDSRHVHAALCEKPSNSIQCKTCFLRVPEGVDNMHWHTVTLLQHSSMYFLGVKGRLCQMRTLDSKGAQANTYNIYEHILYTPVHERATFIGGVPLSIPGLYDDDAWGTTRTNILPPFKGCMRSVFVGEAIASLDAAFATTNSMFKDPRKTVTVSKGCLHCQSCKPPTRCQPEWKTKTATCDCASAFMQRSTVNQQQCSSTEQHSMPMLSPDNSINSLVVNPAMLNKAAMRTSPLPRLSRMWLTFRLPHYEQPTKPFLVCPWIRFNSILKSPEMELCLSETGLSVYYYGQARFYPLVPFTMRQHFLAFDAINDGEGLRIQLDNVTQEADISTEKVVPPMLSSVEISYSKKTKGAVQNGCISELLIPEFYMQLDSVPEGLDLLMNAPGNGSCGLRDTSVFSMSTMDAPFGVVGPQIDVQKDDKSTGSEPLSGLRDISKLGIWLIIGVAAAALLFAVILTALCLVMRSTTHKKTYQQTPPPDKNAVNEEDFIPAHHPSVPLPRTISNDSGRFKSFQRHSPPHTDLTWIPEVSRANTLEV